MEYSEVRFMAKSYTNTTRNHTLVFPSYFSLSDIPRKPSGCSKSPTGVALPTIFFPFGHVKHFLFGFSRANLWIFKDAVSSTHLVSFHAEYFFSLVKVWNGKSVLGEKDFLSWPSPLAKKNSKFQCKFRQMSLCRGFFCFTNCPVDFPNSLNEIQYFVVGLYLTAGLVCKYWSFPFT